MMNYLSIFLSTVVFTISVNAANAQSNTNEDVSKQAKQEQLLPKVQQQIPVVKPATLKSSPDVTDKNLQEIIISSMKSDGVYTKAVEKYLIEFNKILINNSNQVDRSKAFVALDTKYPKSSVIVRNYFGNLTKQETKPKKAPIIYDVPAKQPDTYYAMLLEIKNLIAELQKTKTKLELLESKVNSLRR
jgi:hypothetical protein